MPASPDRPRSSAWSRDFPPLAILAVAGATVFVLSSVVLLGVDLVTLNRVQRGAALTVEDYETINGSVLGVSALAALAAYFTGAPWFYRALWIRRNLLGGAGSHPIWGWFGWIIPLLNLVIPLVLIGRLWAGLGARRLLVPVPFLLGVGWLLLSGLGATNGLPADQPGQDAVDEGIAERLVLYNLAGILFGIAMIAFVVVVTRRQHRSWVDRADAAQTQAVAGTAM